MKNAKLKLSQILALAVMIVGFSFTQAQNSFSMEMTYHEKGYDLKCIEGCNWVSLGWEHGKEINTQYITPVGITNTKPEGEVNEKYHFSILKIKEGYLFKGLKGTNWESLTYYCEGMPCSFKLDQVGVSGI